MSDHSPILPVRTKDIGTRIEVNNNITKLEKGITTTEKLLYGYSTKSPQ